MGGGETDSVIVAAVTGPEREVCVLGLAVASSLLTAWVMFFKADFN
jgi:hypothetical protein